MSKPHTAIWFLFALPVGLAGCHGQQGASNAQAGVGTAAPIAMPTETKALAANVPTLADGPDVCFRAVAKHLGADTKVSELTSFFSSGSEIDSSDTEPKGQMTTCSVQYQNPADPRKLLSTSMNVATGEFAAPSPIEITVTGGDAAAFKLDDYLIPLSKVNAAGLSAVMEAQKAKAAGIYGKYAWSGVRLEAPDAFSNVHTLRLDIDGRLASNDIKGGGYASVSTDGKTVTKNYLKP